MRRLLIAAPIVVLAVVAFQVGLSLYQGWCIRSAITTLKDPEAPVDARIQAVHKLGTIGPATEEVIAALIWALQRSRSHEVAGPMISVPGQAAHELAGFGSAAIPAIIELLENQNARLRHWGARVSGETWETPGLFIALRKLKDHPDVNAALTTALSDEDFHVRYWAAQALGRIAQAGQAHRVIVPAGPKGSEARQVSFWLDNLSHEDALVRAWAADHLGRMPQDARRAVPALKEALKDKHAMVRHTARWALEMIDRDNSEDTFSTDEQADGND